VPIIRRNDCIYATLGTCHSVWMTVWYAGWNETKKLKKNNFDLCTSKYYKLSELTASD